VRKIACIVFLLISFSSSFAATKAEERPDREMLKLMELLRDWEMIKELDLMRQIENLNRMEEPGKGAISQDSQRGKTKDKQK